MGDPVGNRLTGASDAGTTTYAYDVDDRLTTVTAPGPLVTSYSFDANGNQTAAGAQTFTYDFADRLKTATIGATTETYAYAGDGVRLSASTGAAANQITKSLWDRNFGLPQLAIERDGNNALLRSYRYGLDLLRQTAGSTTYYYHPDGLGSAADVTSSTGTSLTWSESYPYGLVRQAGVAGSGAPAVQPFGFTGEQLDSLTGLYHLRARQYDPGTGRFLTTDPLGAGAADLNLYSYARSNPVNRVDPSGMASESTPQLKYCDANVTIGTFAGVTAGVVWDWDHGLRPYVGVAATFPGPASASTTCSFNDVSSGWYVGAQGAFGVAGQVGYGPLFNEEGGGFAEGGIGTPGGTLSAYYVFDGWGYDDIARFLDDLITLPWE